MDILVTILLLTILVAIFYFYSKWKLSYWKRVGVPQLDPELFWGNMREQFTGGLSFGDHFTKFYNQAKSKGYKHIGLYFFLKPSYVPIDINVIKHILQKDFNHFVNHGFYVNEEIDPLTGHLFNLENEKWRSLRMKLTPTFTSGKMKMMFQTLIACTSGLEEILADHSIIQDPVDIKEVISRFTTDIIGSCAFGLDCNSLKNPNSEFRTFGRKIFEPSMYRRVKNTLFFVLPHNLLRFFKIKQTEKELEHFFLNVIRNTIEYREKNNIYRKDFVQLLLQLKNEGQVTDDENIDQEDTQKTADGQFLSVNQIAAQCFVFFIAGFETSATTMTFALLELAMNQDIQNKLRKNILDVLEKHGGQVTYEAVMEMNYLDQVIHETLRKHPPIPGLPRVCNKEYKVPGTDAVIKPGTRVHIPIQGVQRDPEYYPEPEKFEPERFSEENKATRPAYTFLVFGEGPRICIGARFGLMQAKVGLITVIKNFKVTLNEKTKTPIKYENRTFITTVKGGVWLNVSKLK